MSTSISQSKTASLRGAAQNGKIVVVKELLLVPEISVDTKADAETESGFTALHCAAANGHIEVVEEFLSHRDYQHGHL